MVLPSLSMWCRRGGLVTLLASIVFVASPIKSFDNLKGLQAIRGSLWGVLFSFGIDIAIEPFTSDMFFMYDSASDRRGYTSDYKLIVKLEDGAKPLILSKGLDFHHLRLPILLMFDYESSDLDTAGFVHAVCKNIKHLYGVQARAWNVERSEPLSEDPWMRAGGERTCSEAS